MRRVCLFNCGSSLYISTGKPDICHVSIQRLQQPMQQLWMTMLGLLMIGGVHAECLQECAANLLRVRCSKVGVMKWQQPAPVLSDLQGTVAVVVWQDPDTDHMVHYTCDTARLMHIVQQGMKEDIGDRRMDLTCADSSQLGEQVWCATSKGQQCYACHSRRQLHSLGDPLHHTETKMLLMPL